jgi:CTP:molybdopterin cytidylyltransferase MocA
MKIAIILPAAGASRRMRGADKLLQDVDGVTLLHLMAARACAVSDSVLVTLPSADHPRAGVLDGLPVQRIMVPDAAEGMAASLRYAARNLPPEVRGMMILPADMPDITEGELTRIINSFGRDPDAIHQGSSVDSPGHPVLFPADCVPLFATLTGDQGARPIIQAKTHRRRLVPLPGQSAITDLDTPEAWQEWRARR